MNEPNDGQDRAHCHGFSSHLDEASGSPLSMAATPAHASSPAFSTDTTCSSEHSDYSEHTREHTVSAGKAVPTPWQQCCSARRLNEPDTPAAMEPWSYVVGGGVHKMEACSRRHYHPCMADDGPAGQARAPLNQTCL